MKLIDNYKPSQNQNLFTNYRWYHLSGTKRHSQDSTAYEIEETFLFPEQLGEAFCHGQNPGCILMSSIREEFVQDELERYQKALKYAPECVTDWDITFKEIEEEGVEHLARFLGWCRCGNNEQALLPIRDILEWADAEEHAGFDQDGDPKGYALLYFLDKLGCLEHGSSVGYSWITPIGEAVLREIKRTCND